MTHPTGSLSYFWQRGVGLTEITIPSDPRYYSISLIDVSAAGDVFAGNAIIGYRDQSGLHVQGQVGVRWDTTGVVTELAELAGGPVTAYTRAISADGEVIAGDSFYTNDDYEAMLWSNAGTSMSRLGHLGESPYAERSLPRALSADGSVAVGYSSDDEGKTRAFRWTEADGMLEVGTSPLTAHFSYASGVSPNGMFVVGQGRAGLWDVYQPILWDTAANTTLGLGALPITAFGIPAGTPGVSQGGGNAHVASDDGAIVLGTSSISIRINPFGDFKTETLPFIWTPETGMMTPMDFLVQEHGLDLGGGVVTGVFDVSADGRILLASGQDAGGAATQMLLHLDVPEPGGVMCLFWAVVLMSSVPVRGRRSLRF